MAIDVRTFYTEHPINETEILEKIAAEGVAQADIRPEDLSRYDQDHYGGLAATDALAAALGIKAEMAVLDLCSGMGGTSRYLAYRYGVDVLGIDITEPRIAGARRLTDLVGLSGKASYQLGDVTNLDVGNETFDRVLSQESFLHITDREAVFAGCYRVLRTGGGLGFTDVVASDRLSESARKVFADRFAAPRIASSQEYVSLLAAAGFSDVRSTDLSAEWRTILHDRLAMYRSLESETVARYGRDRFDAFISMYEFYIAQIDAGAVGGGRFIGWKR